MIYTKIHLHEMEVITAITQVYSDDIETYILSEDDEILQEDVASIVYALYKAYMELESKQSLLELVNQKTLSINEVA
ncbi:hypothetical protein [Staphylococcus equorum]|uniref:hypothetical protein n=1 Tax=Staphylococcus equorum TaxID=246432 RepID=UPI003FD6EE88